MNIFIRQEKKEDHQEVLKIIKTAFANVEISDHSEHLLVEKLRGSNAFIPELSIVAEYQNELIGHVLLTKIKIKNDLNTFDSLALAPISVLPKFQSKGVGTLLMSEAHKIAKNLGHQSVVLLGHQDYYPRFGYEPTSKYGITLPFEAPEENCMVIALTKEGLQGVTGMVEYAKAFFE